MSPARHASITRSGRLSGSLPHTPGAAVDCEGVVHVYRAAGTDIAALRGIDLRVAAGGQIALLGPSGSGKSTLLTLLAGMRQPSAGAIRIDGRDIARLPPRQQRRYRAETVGSLLQGAADNLLPFASASANVRYAQRAHRRARLAAGPLLDALGLSGPLARRPVSELSPSQQQAAAIAVAMSNSPRLLVADEPTSQLDDAARDDVLDGLLGVVAQAGTTVVVVTHDDAVAARMQRTLHLQEGRIGSEEEASERLPVLGSDRSLHLPADLVAHWPPGLRLRVSAAGPDELRITPADPNG